MANKANLANSVLFAPLSDTDTTLTVYTGDGSLFPSVPFYVTLSPKNKWSRKINSEIVLVTAKSSNVFTITRAQKGTTAKSFDYGDLVANGIYVEDLTEDVVAAALQAMMPVGFVVTLGVSTNPATLYGFGTWTQITGKVIVGKAGSGTFQNLNDTGGAETVTLGVNEMPSHTHTFKWGVNFPRGTGSLATNDLGGDRILVSDSMPGGDTGLGYDWSGGQNGNNNTGGGAAHNNLQPYIVKYVWERTA